MYRSLMSKQTPVFYKNIEEDEQPQFFSSLDDM